MTRKIQSCRPKANMSKTKKDLLVRKQPGKKREENGRNAKIGKDMMARLPRKTAVRKERNTPNKSYHTGFHLSAWQITNFSLNFLAF